MMSKWKGVLALTTLAAGLSLSDLTGVVPTNAQVAQAASATEINVKDFGATGNGTSNDTAAIEAAKAAAKAAGLGLFFPAGTYLIDYSTLNVERGFLIPDAMVVRGAGRRATNLKNMSRAAVAVSIAGFAQLSDLTIDSNHQTGTGLLVFGAYTRVSNIEVRNQAGPNFALEIPNATLAAFDNLQLHNCFNGIRIGRPSGISYLTFNQITIEPAGGMALHMMGSTNIKFTGLYIEPTNDIRTHPKLIYLERCADVDFFAMSCELQGTLTDRAYFVIEDSKSINFFGGKINVSRNGTPSKTIFLTTGTTPYITRNINWSGLQFFVEKPGVVLFEFDGANNPTNVNIANINTELAAPATGVKFTRGGIGASIQNWSDNRQDSSHDFHNTHALFVSNVVGRITVAKSERQTFVNCLGPFSGTGAGTALRLMSSLTSEPGSAVKLGSEGTRVFANNAAALAGGLTAGDTYRTPAGVLMVVY